MEPTSSPNNPNAYKPASTDAGKPAAILAYIGLIGLIIAFVLNSNEKTPLGSFHIRQSLFLQILLFVAYIVGLVLSFIPGVRYVTLFLFPVLGLGGLVLWLFGLIAAIGGEMKPMPLIGAEAQTRLAGVAA